jgi:predicted nucleic acid-binding protein
VIVLSDTSPINYLVLINLIDVLPTLFHQVIIPDAVVAELKHAGTPEKVRAWINNPPSWLLTRSPLKIDSLIQLGRGEVEGING